MKNWSNITLAEFQKLHSIIINEDNEIDKRIKLMAVLTDKTVEDIEELSMADFKQIEAEIGFIFDKPISSKPKKVIFANGRKYRVSYDVSKFNLNKYVTANHFANKNSIDVMHNVLACCMDRQYKFWEKKGKRDYAQICEDLLFANYQDLHSINVFFWKLYRHSMKRLQPSLIQELAKVLGLEAAQRQSSDLLKTLDGFTPQLS